jgi:very-short-patch-repair endonuclease
LPKPSRSASPPFPHCKELSPPTAVAEGLDGVKVGRWEVDFLWQEAGLVVEVDDYSTHSSPRSFERDRRKDAQLRARGLTVQRFTSHQVACDLDFVLAWLRQSTGDGDC